MEQNDVYFSHIRGKEFRDYPWKYQLKSHTEIAFYYKFFKSRRDHFYTCVEKVIYI